ncbi:hypothetical protein [Actinomadura sp. 21ATH]|uniref:hypothetical protein n=1 Tax=Actinomadura sp. 21ATH TaxID=1735444 RepID=UPI0035BEC190
MNFRWTASVSMLALSASIAAPGTAAAAPPPVQKWSITSQTRIPVFDLMNDVVATRAGSAWAVGGHSDHATGAMPGLVYRWNGGTWQRLAVPGALDVTLEHVDASSDTDVWAFGRDWAGPSGKAFHWNGTSWRAFTVLDGDELNAVDAVSPTDVWATGGDRLQHFDGTAWRAVDVPGMRRIGSLHVTSATSGWATGIDTEFRPRIWRWNGKVWNASPLPFSAPGHFGGIVQLGPGNVWAVGAEVYKDDPDGDDLYRSFALRWNGKAWSRVAMPAYGLWLDRPAPDGHGGVWMVAGEKLVNHRAGKWTAVVQPSTPENRTTLANIANVPGTGTMLGVGSIHDDGTSGDDPQDGLFITAR